MSDQRGAAQLRTLAQGPQVMAEATVNRRVTARKILQMILLFNRSARSAYPVRYFKESKDQRIIFCGRNQGSVWHGCVTRVLAAGF
jgi:hypothetical protein